VFGHGRKYGSIAGFAAYGSLWQIQPLNRAKNKLKKVDNRGWAEGNNTLTLSPRRIGQRVVVVWKQRFL